VVEAVGFEKGVFGFTEEVIEVVLLFAVFGDTLDILNKSQKNKYARFLTLSVPIRISSILCPYVIISSNVNPTEYLTLISSLEGSKSARNIASIDSRTV
jgi:hypothetical protein